MEHVKYGTKQIEYRVKRGKRRRTLAINVAPTAQVIVLAPAFVSKEEIKAVVRKKARWIVEKQEYFKQLATLFPEKEFISGEQILFLGRRYRLKVKEVQQRRSSVPRLVGRRIFVSVAENSDTEEKKEKIKDALRKWYFSKSGWIIKQRVDRYSKLLNVIPREVKIKNQEKRWGSCSDNGILRFNWKVSMAPISVVDYIVVHEICHLKIKNHSPDFWKLVSLALPDYQKRRDWLRSNAAAFRL